MIPSGRQQLCRVVQVLVQPVCQSSGVVMWLVIGLLLQLTAAAGQGLKRTRHVTWPAAGSMLDLGGVFCVRLMADTERAA